MSSDVLIKLAQLQSMLREIHTSGDDTLRMAQSLSLANQIIQFVQDMLNKKDNEEQ